MKTRMEKYYDEDPKTLSRSHKNKELYKEVNTTEIETFDLNSNVSILGDNSKNIDIYKIQEILDKKYKVEPRKKNSNIVEREPESSVDLDETREYDINEILNKAKENKEVDYEVDRLKKLRNTQYDILNNLDLEPKNENELDDITTEQAKLMDLINTITSKELANDIAKENEKELDEDNINGEDLDPLDILTDLRGDDDDTKAIGIIKEDEENTIETKEFKVEEKEKLEDTEEQELDKTNDELIEIEEPEENKKKSSKKELNLETIQKTSENLFNTTGSIQFSQSDFDDFNDLKDDMKAAKIIIKILIILIIIAFVIGCVFLANSIFDLGLI